jgi:hypothetical protein
MSYARAPTLRRASVSGQAPDDRVLQTKAMTPRLAAPAAQQ